MRSRRRLRAPVCPAEVGHGVAPVTIANQYVLLGGSETSAAEALIRMPSAVVVPA
jgi:hypothetical protein